LLKKVRRRYLAVEIESGEMFGSKEFMDAVWSTVLRLYGEYGASRTGLTLIDYDVEKRFAVMRATQRGLEMVRTALVSITSIEGKPAAAHVLTVSGTIRALYRRIKK
jgi:RNase P/RNase MRP subunit POP5